MMTDYIFYCLVITKNLAIGNALAALLDTTGGNLTFMEGAKLRLIGSQDTEPTAWGSAVPLRQSAYDALIEFKGPAPFPTLNSMGVSDADVLAYQPLMIISVGDRASLEGHGLEFIAANGYEVIPDA